MTASDILIQQRDLSFLLWDWLRLDTLLARPEYDGHDRETVDAVLDLSTQLARDAFLPHFKEADHHEPSLDGDGEVHILPAAITALKMYAEVGLFAAGFAPEIGGLGLPSMVTSASLSQFNAANPATAAYVMLTIANARLIATFGTPAQIDAFARPQIEGRQLGTMCLSEPQAGSGLGDVRTRAQPDGEDTLGPHYRLSGTKMWISGGDQNATRNIVHLVLAKIPDPDGSLPEGTKGISLFIVPKWLGAGEDGGERNDVTVAGLNHKMGYRGTANCLLNFGEGRYKPGGEAGAVGYRLGEAGKGLALMFQMMNEARIAVGLGAAAIAYRGYRHSVQYARERTQGRALDAPRGATAAIPIIEHPDVQRMLLAQKAYAEGALALTLYCAKLVDEEIFDPDASELLALLTPVAKTWPSEWGLLANQLAIQVHGGYGYTRDFDVEQLYRDNRLNAIHEGTTGIQALDLLGRKILRGNNAGLTVLHTRVHNTIEVASASPRLRGFAEQLLSVWRALDATLAVIRAADDPNRALSNATPFLQAFGHIVVAWLWLDQAAVCDRALAEGATDTIFYDMRIRTCRFFYECELPSVDPLLGFVRSMSDVAAHIPAEMF